MDARVPAGLTRADYRRFGFVVGAAFLGLAALFAWRGHSVAVWVAASLGTLLVLGGLLAPGALGPVYRAWMSLGLLLSRVVTPVVMAVLYFVVLTPFGLVMRLFGHRPLERGAPDSYWVLRPEGKRRSNLIRPF